MKRFAIRSNNGTYANFSLDKKHVYWTRRELATLFEDEDDAKARAKELTRRNTEKRRTEPGVWVPLEYEIITIDIDAAIKVLRDLFSVRDLGDLCYDIREREGQGWDGPLVTKWSDAVAKAMKLLKDYEYQTSNKINTNND